MKAKAINVLIIDDEKKACNNLKSMLAEYGEKGIVVGGVATNTREAEHLVRELKPDAVFIDIDMPKENAFQFLQRIAPVEFEVVFVTAYDQYAVKAFRLNAVDYILKPIDIDELVIAVEKLMDRVRIKKIKDKKGISYLELLEQVDKKAECRTIRLKSTSHSELIDLQNIYFIEAQGSYSRIVFMKENNTAEIIMSRSLSEYEEILPANIYYRIHKTYLINCAHVTSFTTDENCHVVLKNMFTIPVSRRRLISMKTFLKSNGYFL